MKGIAVDHSNTINDLDTLKVCTNPNLKTVKKNMKKTR